MRNSSWCLSHQQANEIETCLSSNLFLKIDACQPSPTLNAMTSTRLNRFDENKPNERPLAFIGNCEFKGNSLHSALDCYPSYFESRESWDSSAKFARWAFPSMKWIRVVIRLIIMAVIIHSSSSWISVNQPHWPPRLGLTSGISR